MFNFKSNIFLSLFQNDLNEKWHQLSTGYVLLSKYHWYVYVIYTKE